MKLCFVFLVFTLAQEISFDLQEYRSPLFDNWCNISLTQDQLGWSRSQPPQEWCNITLLSGGKAFQITARDENGKIEWGEASYVIRFEIGDNGYYQYRFKISINYWGKGFTLYYATIPSIFRCKQNATIHYGTHV